MAARPTMLRSLVVIGLAALLAPPAAWAHVRSGRVAADYRARLLPLRGRVGTALQARIYQSDRALRLALRSGHAVVVLGYLDEPFLRLDSAGWAANAASPTAVSAKLLKGQAAPGPGLRWVLQSTRPTVVWHDVRTRGLAPGVKRGRWRVRVIVDGSPTALEGEIWRVQRPSVAAWLGLAAVLGAAMFALLVVRRRHDEPVLVGLAVVAACATAVTALGFALDAYASGGTWLASADELLFVAIGLAILAKGRGPWVAGAIAGLGFLAVFVAVTKGAAFFHGVVFSALPAGVARAAIAVGLASGVAAACAGAVRFLGSPKVSGSDLTGAGRTSLE